MSEKKIGFRLDDVLASTKRLIDDLGEFPGASEVRPDGPGLNYANAGAVQQEVVALARQYERVILWFQHEMGSLSEAIRKTVTDLAEVDASVADDARRFLEALDSVVPAAARGAAAGGAAGTGAGAGKGAGTGDDSDAGERSSGGTFG